MNFTSENAEKVLAGTKTRTTRVQRDDNEVCRYVVGRTYAVCPGRTKSSVGRILVTNIRCYADAYAFVCGMTRSERDAHGLAEGYVSYSEWWFDYARLCNDPDGEKPCWVIDFELVKGG